MKFSYSVMKGRMRFAKIFYIRVLSLNLELSLDRVMSQKHTLYQVKLLKSIRRVHYTFKLVLKEKL